jgi:hypothetical protein
MVLPRSLLKEKDSLSFILFLFLLVKMWENDSSKALRMLEKQGERDLRSDFHEVGPLTTMGVFNVTIFAHSLY